MIYRKGASGWVQEARLEPTPVEEDTAAPAYRKNLAINANGTVVVVGLPDYYLPAPGASEEGAFYIFRRGSSGWALDKMNSLGEVRSWLYAKAVDIDDAGQTVAVWRPYLDGQGEGSQQGAVEIWKYSTAWNLQSFIPVPAGVSSCEAFSLSGNGRILARLCDGNMQVFELQGAEFVLRQTLQGGGDYVHEVDTTTDGSLIVRATAPTAPQGANWRPYHTVYRRDASGWKPDPAFTFVGGRATKPPSNYYGGPTTISADGRFIAVGSYSDENAGSGVVRGPLTRDSSYSGAVFVFERKPTAWSLRNMIKPNVPSYQGAFGYGVSFGDNGKILAVGAYGENSGARGIDGDQADTSSPDSGAAWLY
jgi:hypothetical protein